MRQKYSQVCGVMPRLILLLVLSGLMATLAFMFYVSPMYSHLEPDVVTRPQTPIPGVQPSKEASPSKTGGTFHSASRRKRELEEKRRSMRRQRTPETIQREQPVVKLKLIPVRELQERIKSIRSSADLVRLFTEQDLSDEEIYTWMGSYTQQKQETIQTDPLFTSKPSKRVKRADRADLRKSSLGVFDAALNDSETSTSQQTVEKNTDVLRGVQIPNVESNHSKDNGSLLTLISGRDKEKKASIDQENTDAEKELFKAYDQLRKFLQNASRNGVYNHSNVMPSKNIRFKGNYKGQKNILTKNISATAGETSSSITSEWSPLGPLENSSSIHELFSFEPEALEGVFVPENTNATLVEEFEDFENLPNVTKENVNFIAEDFNSATINSTTLKFNASEKETVLKMENKSSEIVTMPPVIGKVGQGEKHSNGTLKSLIFKNSKDSATTKASTTTSKRRPNLPANYPTDTNTAKPTPKGKTPEEYNFARLVRGLHLEEEEAFWAAAYRLDEVLVDSEEYKCQKPTKYLQSVSHPYLTQIMLVPDCVMLHRCLPHSGCCHGPSVCGPKTVDVVHIPFLVLTINDQRARLQPDSALFLSFLNHTECTCVVDDEYIKSMTACEKHCPHPFQLARVGHSCICDCQNNNRKNKANFEYCQEIKHGARPLEGNGLSCIKGDKCNEPECEIGVFNKSTGYCPLSDEYALPSCFLWHKHRGKPRHYRGHLRLPSLRSTTTTELTTTTTTTTTKLNFNTKRGSKPINLSVEANSSVGVSQPGRHRDYNSSGTNSHLTKMGVNNGSLGSSLSDNISSVEEHSDELPVTNAQSSTEYDPSETTNEQSWDPSLSTVALESEIDLDYESEEREEENDSLPYIGEKTMAEIYSQLDQTENLNHTELFDDEE